MKKHHKHKKKIIRIFLLLMLPLLLLSLTTSHEQRVRADDEEIVVTPKFTPNKDPKKFLGIWMSNGYGLQPNPDSYTTVGKQVTLRTSAGRSVWSVILGLLDGAHYRWWQSTDGKNWSKVDKSDNGHKKNFSVTPTKVGTVWYQLDTQYYTLLTPYLKTHIYSRVAAVHTLSESVNATDLDVTVDDDYLYNTSDELSNTTYAHAIPIPDNSTGILSWSVDNTNLATVDEDGQVTANNKGISGSVKVLATMTNDDGSKITRPVSVEIGGGLDDRTVNSGETANFELKGNTGGDGDDDGNTGSVTVDWYKYAPGSNSKVKVASGPDTNYTTDKTTFADDGSYFQAIITIKAGKVTKTITSNKAKLTVIPAGKPDISIINKITDDTYPHENNTDLILNDIINDDSVTYRGSITNESLEGTLKNGNYVIPLRSGTQINSVKVAGETLTSDQYTTIFDDETDSDNLVIPIKDLNPTESKAIEVNTTVQGILKNTSFKSTPYVYGTDNDNGVYRQDGMTETLNYLSNQIEPQIQDIDFGAISAYSKNTLKYRPNELNNPNNIVDVEDYRRDKGALQVYVSQDNEFIHESKSATLPASLRYYNNGSHTDILNNKVLISETDIGITLDPIAWNKSEGLLLHINDNQLLTGKYSTTLTWYFENSI
ncbi:hypothetical protein [Companilactobacillus kimchiensis]|nr:hypothetical protein [Companilactobacillus kimchiensis]